MSLAIQQDKRTYLERLTELESKIDSGQMKIIPGTDPHHILQNQLLGEFEGIQFTGRNIAKWTADKIRSDMHTYDNDHSKYTMSLGAAQGLFAQQCMIAAKKEREGNLDGVYIYLSGWQVAGMNAPESPQPDMSAHSKDAVVKTVKDNYEYLHQADKVEKVKIFNKINEARKEGKTGAELAQLYSEVDNFKTHIVPTICDIDAGFGNAAAIQMLCTRLSEVGAGCFQLENQDSINKKCGHLGGKVTIPYSTMKANAMAARLGGIEGGVDNIVITLRTDSLGADLSGNHEANSIYADHYNQHLEMVEFDPKAPLKKNEMVFDYNGKLMKASRDEATGLYNFKKGTGEARVIKDCIFYQKECGADLVWIETDTPNVEVMKRIVDGIRKESPETKLVYNNSPSFQWTANIRAKILEGWHKEAEGNPNWAQENKINLNEYPDPKGAKFKAEVGSAKYKGTTLDQTTQEYIRTFQSELAKQAGVFHHLITLPNWHIVTKGAQDLAAGFFRTEERAKQLGTTYGMAHYVVTVQDGEIDAKHSSVNHQTTAGTGINTYHQLEAYGDGAKTLTGDSKEGTHHGFDNLIAANTNPTGNVHTDTAAVGTDKDRKVS